MTLPDMGPTHDVAVFRVMAPDAHIAPEPYPIRMSLDGATLTGRGAGRCCMAPL